MEKREIIKYKKYYFWFLTHIEKCGIPQNDVVEYNMPGLEEWRFSFSNYCFIEEYIIILHLDYYIYNNIIY